MSIAEPLSETEAALSNGGLSNDDAESEVAAADEYIHNNSKINESIEVEYITEKADVEEAFLVLGKFNLSNSEVTAEDDEEEQDVKQKEKGVSNKKKKIQIAELIQISSRPDIVEVRLREMKPGMLSHELKEALGMLDGAPPPWLINMQRYGPPPSFPHIKIPDLNAPIPPGASFGYHSGGWGKPPVDEFGSPLYGDVFGIQQKDQPNYQEELVDRSKHRGDLKEEEEEEEEEEEMEAGMQSVDSFSSIPTGVGTPDVIELLKQQRKELEKPLYQVLEKKDENIAPGTLLGTTHSYNLPALDKTATKRVDLPSGQKSDKVDVTIQPEDLEAMDDVLAAKYEEARKEWLQNQKADFSDMFAEVDRGIMIKGVIGSKINGKLTIQRKGKKTWSQDNGEEIDKFSYYRAKYIHHFLEKMHRYIWSVDNTSNDGHCGFNALARHLGYFQIDGWRQVREELYQELETRLPFYTKILGEEIVAHLLTSIPCTESVADKGHYMRMPHVAYLFANRYKMPIVLLSLTMNYTFFPMCAPPADHRETTLCAIGNVRNHYVIPRLIDHSPIPPPPKTWYQHKPAEAIPWITPYLDAIWAYKKMMEINNPCTHV